MISGGSSRRTPAPSAPLPSVRLRPHTRLLLAAVAVGLAVAGCSGGSAPSATTSAATGGGVPSASGSPAPSGPSATPAPGVATASPAGFATVRTKGGTLLVTTLAGRRSGVRMRVWVWLPPQYDAPGYEHTYFPAVMLYPGGSGAGYNTWSGHAYGAQQFVATASARAGSGVSPMVFVMPQMQLSAQQDTECADLPGQPKVGTFLADDVRDLVLRSFRVRADRRSWGAAGASSGAYCAARLVFDHPDQYAAVVPIDGYFRIQTKLAGGRDPKVLAGDPQAVATASPPDVAVLLWVGSSAKTDVRESAAFLAALRPPTRGTLRTLPGGRHLTRDFAKMMPDVFTWLSGQLASPSNG